MKILPRILFIPLSCEPLPPMLHYGYPVAISRLMQISVDGGYTGPTWADTCGSVGGHLAAITYISESIKHDIDIPAAFVNGQERFVVSICTNWFPAKGVGEIVRRLKEFLGETEDPQWYVDTDKWYWRK